MKNKNRIAQLEEQVKQLAQQIETLKRTKVPSRGSALHRDVDCARSWANTALNKVKSALRTSAELQEEIQELSERDREVLRWARQHWREEDERKRQEERDQWYRKNVTEQITQDPTGWLNDNVSWGQPPQKSIEEP